ncbi:FAD-dependent oxidoreductase [Candidatus Berkelbacteria bacterium]|nr:FAD-dependent oxidoreductase [Candidatus Berkelbacteria bacterium]
MNIPQIVIVGGGFGGCQVLTQLAPAIQNGEIRVTVINPELHHLYTPSLYEVVGGTHPRQVCIPLAALAAAAGAVFERGTVSRISLREQAVTCADGTRFAYDHLILAVGSVTNFYGIRGLKEYAYPFKSLRDAWVLRQHIEQEFADAAHDSREIAERKLTIVIAGGGPTGVELAGELAGFTRRLALLHRIPLRRIAIELVEAGPTLVGRAMQEVQRLARARLRRLGVHITVQTTVKEERIRSIVLSHGTRQSETLIWTAGTAPHPLLATIRGLTTDRTGKIVVDGSLRAHGHPTVWVIGDSASVSDTGTAQAALRHGRSVAANLLRTVRQHPLIPYEAKPSALIMPIGRQYAVAQIGSYVVAGWLVALLRHLVDFRYLLHLVPLGLAWQIFTARHEPCPDCHQPLRDLLAPR